MQNAKRKTQNAKCSELRCNYNAVASNQTVVVNAFMRSTKQQTHRSERIYAFNKVYDKLKRCKKVVGGPTSLFERGGPSSYLSQ